VSHCELVDPYGNRCHIVNWLICKRFLGIGNLRRISYWIQEMLALPNHLFSLPVDVGDRIVMTVVLFLL
jgi:hypothetical protein